MTFFVLSSCFADDKNEGLSHTINWHCHGSFTGETCEMETSPKLENGNDSLTFVTLSFDNGNFASQNMESSQKEDLKGFLDSLYLDLDKIFLDANGYPTQNLKVEKLSLLEKIKSLDETLNIRNQHIQVSAWTTNIFNPLRHIQ